MGSIFKKIGKAVKKVADVHKKIIKKTIDVNKAIVKKTIQAPTKKLLDVAKKGVHFINRYTNPGTILLRNGFLLAMKVNLFNISGRLRYAYLSDEEARKRDMNPDALAKVRKIKDKAEKIYYDAGGMKSNFKKAVLKGRGNKKHNPVPLNGLGGFDEDIYADEQEYAILYGFTGTSLNGDGLGEIAAGASIAAAMAAVGAVAGALKQVKGLFNKGGAEEKSFSSETDNASTVDEAKSGNIPDSEDEVRTDDANASVAPDTDSTYWLTEATNAANSISQAASSVAPVVQEARAASAPLQTETNTQYNYETDSQAENTPGGDTNSGAAVPNIYTAPGGNTANVVKTSESTPGSKPKDEPGIFQKTTTWVKDNPGKSLLIAGAVATGGYIVMRAMSGSKHSSSGQSLSGFSISKPPKHSRRKKRKSTKRNRGVRKAQHARQRITFTKLL